MGKPKASRQAQEDEYNPIALPPDYLFIRLGPPRGSSNYTCTDPQGVDRLVEIGSRIRKTVLATRGQFSRVILHTS
jgi:probable RNA-binding protein EIF1AD